MPTSLLPDTTEPSHMRFSVHLFKLAKINSEIKYVANSINRAAPPYALPVVADIQQWQKGILQSLSSWADELPDTAPDYTLLICQVRYHSVRMLATSPSPAIPKPGADVLEECYVSTSSITIWRFSSHLRRRTCVLETLIDYDLLTLFLAKNI